MNDIPRHDPRNFKVRLEQGNTQLLSLEMSLLHQQQSGDVSSVEHDKKWEQLRQLKRVQEDLQGCLREEMALKKASADGDLPPLNKCSPHELQICHGYLNQKHNQVIHLTQQLTKIFNWVQQAYHGSGFWLGNVFRLSKLRVLREKIQSAETNLQQKGVLFDKTKTELIRTPKIPQHAPENINSMLQLYKKVETLNRRIYGLQESIAREKQTIHRMEKWLEQHQPQNPGLKFSASPSLSALRAATEKSRLSALKTIDISDRRLQSVQQFIDHQLNLLDKTKRQTNEDTLTMEQG